MSDYPQKIFTIHFPDKKVYIENTYKSLYDKLDIIRKDKDHYLYPLLKDYPNAEVRFECYQSCDCGTSFCACNKKLVASEYIKDSYKIMNVNLISPTKFIPVII